MIEIIIFHLTMWMTFIFYSLRSEKLMIMGKKKILSINTQFLAKSFLFRCLFFSLYLSIIKEELFLMIFLMVYCELEIHDSILKKTKNNMIMNDIYKNCVFWFTFLTYGLLIIFTLECIESSKSDIILLFVFYVSENFLVSFFLISFCELNSSELKFSDCLRKWKIVKSVSHRIKKNRSKSI